MAAVTEGCEVEQNKSRSFVLTIFSFETVSLLSFKVIGSSSLLEIQVLKFVFLNNYDGMLFPWFHF